MVWPTGPLREDVPCVNIDPRRQVPVRLALALVRQHSDQAVVEVDGAHCVTALACRGDDDVAEGRVDLDDPNVAPLEVDVRPAQGDQLADAQTGSEQEGPQRVLTVALHEAEERARLLRRPVPGDGAPGRRPRRADQGVDGNNARGDGQLEGAGDRCSSKADGVGGERLAGLGAAGLGQRALPGEHNLGVDVSCPAVTEDRAHVDVGVLAVVEAGLCRQPAIGVDPVEVQVEQLVARQAWCSSSPVRPGAARRPSGLVLLVRASAPVDRQVPSEPVRPRRRHGSLAWLSPARSMGPP